MATSNVVSFTDTNSNPQKIAAVSIFSIIDDGSTRIVETAIPTKSIKTTATLSSLSDEAGNLFEGTVTATGFTTAFNTIFVQRLYTNSANGCDVIFQGQNKITLDETVAIIEGRIDAIGAVSEFVTKTKSADYTILPTDDLITFTAAATATLPAASEAIGYITITADGGDVTVMPDGSDTIMDESDGLISDGSSWTLYPNGTNWILR